MAAYRSPEDLSRYEGLISARDSKAQYENDVKDYVKHLSFKLKEERKLLNAVTRERRKLDRQIAKFWPKVSARKSRDRQWAKQNPGQAFEKVIAG